MNVTRRQFLKLSGAVAATLAVVELGFDEKTVKAKSGELKISKLTPTPTICPYCAVGCGILVYANENDVVYTEGDPDNPINEGTLCSKGTTLRQVYTSEKRVTKPLYRAPGSDKWEEVDWEFALDKVVKNIKETRDRGFIEKEDGVTVNRTDNIACLGGAALDNEECHLLQKLFRAGLGLSYIEHQARICHSSTVTGLAPSFGRGAMTNHWNDLQHADVLMVIGANPAENHPISFRWIQKALQKGGKLISVDPRYTRTSQMADLYGQMRSGTDIAFVGGMINYILENNLYHKEYVAAYTNASYLVAESFSFEDGLFSGYNEETRSYDKSQWAFQTDEEGNILKDPTLEHPRSVFQLLKKHYSRYDVDTVIATTGTDKDTYLDICKTFASTGEVGKAGTILYAMGVTQHTVGSQNIRLYAILQLLLGNIGIQGGGVNALRGESNVQGSTDFGLLYHNVPGYMDVPNTGDSTYQEFLDRITPKSGFKVNFPKFYTSMLKSFYGDSATKDNDFGFEYLPKITKGKAYSFLRVFDAMYRKELEGLLLFGSNPAVGGPNALKQKEAMANLKWMAVIDLFETETSSFWQEVAGSDPASIQTEVIFLPACSSYEKEGSISNSGRWMQYRWQAIEPKGDSKADFEIMHMIVRRLKELYKNESSPAARQLQALSWDYGDGEQPDLDLVCREINGYYVDTKEQVKGFGDLRDDGTTVCGNWIYSGFYPGDENLSKRRDNKDTGMGNFLNWAYAWPANRRVLYNRASADLNGKPWSKDRVGIYWDAAQGKWVGNDVPDFAVTKGPNDPTFNDPFLMQVDGKGALFAASMNEGPFPEHYEPFENPMDNLLSRVNLNPAVQFGEKAMEARGDITKFPIIATTFRLSEHWQSGAMTRNVPWLAELMNYMFVEISEELAEEKGIKPKDKVIVSSARGEIEAYAMITKRFKPYKLKGKTVHHIGMPWHYGYKGIATGDIANRLTPHIGDANSTIPEYKAFLCDIRRA